jgi:hypothetical protein
LAVISRVAHVGEVGVADVVGDGEARICGVVVGRGPVEGDIGGEGNAEAGAVRGPAEGCVCGGLTACYVE